MEELLVGSNTQNGVMNVTWHLWHRCHRNPFSVYTRDISHAPVYTRNMLSKYRSAPGQGDCHRTWLWVHLTVRMLHDIYDMDVIISHPCHRYFFNKYGKLREKAGSTCNTVAVLPVASMSWLWHPRQCHSRLLLSKFFEQFLQCEVAAFLAEVTHNSLWDRGSK